ncbi:MAG: NAD-dependent epimerase/dehydratase family protein [Defluviitaleaceae bacterium]|nr:NAD-dependent epimerase/dehydratase family protein [Defluviitaleaceae bacterium]
MKVLVIGKNGYIAKSFAEYASCGFSIDIVDSYEEWKSAPFEGYDTVLFAAGIAHRRQTNQKLYYEVNCDLAVSIAKKAKLAKVPHFIYLSSMAVYGKKEGKISANTIAQPTHNDYYGQSKFKAENALKNLLDDNFSLAIIRPPMVYGENCPGKYATLEKISKFLWVVPNNNNKRSILYINNLSMFLCMVITRRETGILCPHDKEYANTAELVKKIRQNIGKNTHVINAGILIKILSVLPAVKTAFSSLYYEMGEGAE